MSCPRGCCATYKEHLRAVTINTAVASPRRAAERQNSADMDAYKRLRANGIQPKAIEGAAALERGASTVHEVETAAIITDARERAKVTKAFETAKDFAVKPLDSAAS